MTPAEPTSEASNADPTAKDRPVAGSTIVPNAEHLAALREFSAAAGHEINNPLAVILGRVQLLLREERDPAKRQSLETIAGQATRIRDMIGDVMLFSTPPKPHFTEFEVEPLIREIVETLQPINKDVSIQTTFASQLVIAADREQFATVISELLRNALHPGVAATQVEVVLDTASKPKNGLSIIVRDDGKGLSEEEERHLFNPFYSGRQAGRGLGFGLCKVWQFVMQHQGTITAATHKHPRSGCEFSLFWPSLLAQDSLNTSIKIHTNPAE